MWFARDGSVKSFDFDASEVSTFLSDSLAQRLLTARKLDLFDFFLTPDLVLEEAGAGKCVIREQLFELPCIGLQSMDEQLESVRQVSRTYTRYVLERSLNPDPSRFLSCFDQVAACLNPTDRVRMEAKRREFTEFVQAARLVESHLDFNVANFLGGRDRPLVLLDIGDAGLVLPATYDSNNLLLNEVYRGRSGHLLEAVLRSPEALGYDDLLRATLGRSSPLDFRRSLFANFVLRESPYVSCRLLGDWSPERVRQSWHQFETQIPGWPFEAVA
jgi:hypothetical protein